MSRFDYSGLVAVAENLITRFGAPATALIPGSPDVAIELAITDFSDNEVDGDHIKFTDQQGWSFPPSGGEDLRDVDAIVADGVRFDVVDTLVIKPATTVIAYRFVLRG